MTVPRLLTEDSLLYCAHGGRVVLAASQDLVRIAGRRALVEPDLLARPICACPNATPSTPPCGQTVAVDQAPSHSAFVRIDGRPVCKDSAIGRTDWSKLGVVPFNVGDARQEWIGIGE